MAAAPLARRAGWEATRKRELGLIHIAKAHLGWSRDDYECMLKQLTGKTSAADLTDGERHRVLQHCKRLGFQVKAQGAAKKPLGSPQHRKLRAMWYALADVGAVERPADPLACDAAVEAWAVRQLGAGRGGELGVFSALRFATTEQLTQLIEELKSWGDRVEARIRR